MKVYKNTIPNNELAALVNEDGYAKFVVAIPVMDLVKMGNIDGFNDYIDHHFIYRGMIGDISYKVVNCDIRDDEIHIEVCAKVEDL